MISVHCNQCFRKRSTSKGSKFFISRCYHVICKQCLSEKCPICGHIFQGTQISSQMSPAVQACFEDPLKLLQRYQKTAKFHAEQYASLVRHYMQEQKQKKDKAKREYEQHVKVLECLKMDLSEEKKRFNKLKEYIAVQKRCMEHYEQNYTQNRSKTYTQTPPLSLSLQTITLSDDNEVDASVNLTQDYSNNNNNNNAQCYRTDLQNINDFIL